MLAGGSPSRLGIAETGNHVDSYFDRYRQEPAYVRPVLPCYWAAFGELEEWVENKGENPRPPGSTTVPQPTPEGTPEDANTCSINEEATYTPPAADGPWSALMDLDRASGLLARGGPAAAALPGVTR